MTEAMTETQTIAIRSIDEIPKELRGNPFETLLRGNILQKADDPGYEKPELLIIQCMDYRKRLILPKRFAYVVRNAGSNMKANEFSVAFAVAIGKIKHIAVISHTDCAMMNVTQRRQEFVDGIAAEAGWEPHLAETFFDSHGYLNEISDPVSSAKIQVENLRNLYPQHNIQAFLYKVEDDQLYFIPTT